MLHTVTHTHNFYTYIPVASKQLDSNEVRSMMKKIFVIIIIMYQISPILYAAT